MNSENETSELEHMLPSGHERRAERRAQLEQIDQWCNQLPESCQALARYLIERLVAVIDHRSSNEQVIQELREIQAEQRKLLDEMIAPPWHPAIFIRRIETTSGLLAEVSQRGSARLVRCGEGVSADDLVEGQVVYLGHELNVILGVAPAGQSDAGEITIVDRILDDGRLALRDRDVLVLARQVNDLRTAGLVPGESVRWDRDAMLVLERVEADKSSELFVTEYLSAQPAQFLGGLESEVGQVVALFTQFIAQPEMAARYGLTRGNTLLLHGPPGNGKTSMARIAGSALAAATGSRCRFASVNGAQLESPWVGASEEAVRSLFRDLRRGECPTVLFIDEVEAIGRTRGGLGGHHSDKFLSTWLTEIDGLVSLPGTLGIIASTNRKDLIDQALLERLSGTELYIGRPRRDAAREIFDIHLPATLPFGPNGSEAANTREDIIEMAVGTFYSPNADNAIAELRFRDGTSRTVTAGQLLSGRAIEQICVQARRSAFQRHTETGSPGVRVEDMEEAIAQALERLASTLSPINAHALLSDLPQDLDVVAVEPVRRMVKPHRYLYRGTRSRASQ